MATKMKKSNDKALIDQFFNDIMGEADLRLRLIHI